MSTEANKVAKRSYFDAVNRRDLGIFDTLFDPDYVLRSVGLPEVHGPETLKRMVSGSFNSLSDIELVIDDMVAEDDKVVTRWSLLRAGLRRPRLGFGSGDLAGQYRRPGLAADPVWGQCQEGCGLAGPAPGMGQWQRGSPRRCEARSGDRPDQTLGISPRLDSPGDHLQYAPDRLAAGQAGWSMEDHRLHRRDHGGSEGLEDASRVTREARGSSSPWRKEFAMAGPLETVVRQMFAAFDHKNFRDALRAFADDTQVVDEISRKWIRGHAGVADYVRQLELVIEGIHTEIDEVREQVWGDAGLMTCWVEQDYTLKGKAQHISSPTTVVLRREGREWRIVLFHAIPLPGE